MAQRVRDAKITDEGICELLVPSNSSQDEMEEALTAGKY